MSGLFVLRPSRRLTRWRALPWYLPFLPWPKRTIVSIAVSTLLGSPQSTAYVNAAKPLLFRSTTNHLPSRDIVNISNIGEEIKNKDIITKKPAFAKATDGQARYKQYSSTKFQTV